MKYLIRVIYGIIFLNSLLLFSCNKQDKFVKFAKDEEAEIRLETEKIISEFGYNNYKIFTYLHKNIGRSEVSKSMNSNKAVGSGLLPLFDQLTDSTSYSASISNNFDGYFEQRSITVNYDYDYKNNIIIYDYFSIVIIFDNISTEQKNELLKLLNIYIVNSNRGDMVYITSREEIQNK
jgi:hypothetical protein